jgi:hypothetical protein
MAEKLLRYYKFVADEKGVTGQLELAKITKVPATRAASALDDKATLEAFRKAATEITGKPAPAY